MPGGHLDDEEELSATLRRELFEEVAVTLLSWGILGYEKTYSDNEPECSAYHIRAWAKVRILNQPYQDPDNKSMGRVVLNFNQALEQLGYGEKGKIWLKQAIKYVEEI